ncbi:MAG: hypothetical protein QW568_02235 [Candidatus Anstonellaceae archaeon]
MPPKTKSLRTSQEDEQQNSSWQVVGTALAQASKNLSTKKTDVPAVISDLEKVQKSVGAKTEEGKFLKRIIDDLKAAKTLGEAKQVLADATRNPPKGFIEETKATDSELEERLLNARSNVLSKLVLFSDYPSFDSLKGISEVSSGLILAISEYEGVASRLGDYDSRMAQLKTEITRKLAETYGADGESLAGFMFSGNVSSDGVRQNFESFALAVRDLHTFDSRIKELALQNLSSSQIEDAVSGMRAWFKSGAMDFILSKIYGKNLEGLSAAGFAVGTSGNIGSKYFDALLGYATNSLNRRDLVHYRTLYANQFGSATDALFASRDAAPVELNEQLLRVLGSRYNQGNIVTRDSFDLVSLKTFIDYVEDTAGVRDLLGPSGMSETINSLALMEPKTQYLFLENRAVSEKIIIASKDFELSPFPYLQQLMKGQDDTYRNNVWNDPYSVLSKDYYGYLEKIKLEGTLFSNIMSYVNTDQGTINIRRPVQRLYLAPTAALGATNFVGLAPRLNAAIPQFKYRFPAESPIDLYDVQNGLRTATDEVYRFGGTMGTYTISYPAYYGENLGYRITSTMVSEALQDAYLNANKRALPASIIAGGGEGQYATDPVSSGGYIDARVIQPGGASTHGRGVYTKEEFFNPQDEVTASDRIIKGRLDSNRFRVNASEYGALGSLWGDAFLNYYNKHREEIIANTQEQEKKMKNIDDVNFDVLTHIYSGTKQLYIVGTTALHQEDQPTQNPNEALYDYMVYYRDPQLGWTRVFLQEHERELIVNQALQAANAQLGTDYSTANDFMNHMLAELGTSISGKAAPMQGGVERYRTTLHAPGSLDVYKDTEKIGFYFGINLPKNVATLTAKTIREEQAHLGSAEFSSSTVVTGGYFIFNENDALNQAFGGFGGWQSYRSGHFRLYGNEDEEGFDKANVGYLEYLLINHMRVNAFAGATESGGKLFGVGGAYERNLSAGAYLSYNPDGSPRNVLATASGTGQMLNMDFTALGSYVESQNNPARAGGQLGMRNRSTGLGISAFGSTFVSPLATIGQSRIAQFGSRLDDLHNQVSQVDKPTRSQIGQWSRQYFDLVRDVGNYVPLDDVFNTFGNFGLNVEWPGNAAQLMLSKTNGPDKNAFIFGSYNRKNNTTVGVGTLVNVDEADGDGSKLASTALAKFKSGASTFFIQGSRLKEGSTLGQLGFSHEGTDFLMKNSALAASVVGGKDVFALKLFVGNRLQSTLMFDYSRIKDLEAMGVSGQHMFSTALGAAAEFWLLDGPIDSFKGQLSGFVYTDPTRKSKITFGLEYEKATLNTGTGSKGNAPGAAMFVRFDYVP